MRRRYEFNKAYFERFYGYPRIRVSDAKEFAVLGEFVCAYLRYLGQPVRRVLDIGCGLGFWRDVVARYYPKARYTGVEISDYLCGQYGWTRGSVVDFKARGGFDLLICTDVLQYLPNADASAVSLLGRQMKLDAHEVPQRDDAVNLVVFDDRQMAEPDLAHEAQGLRRRGLRAQRQRVSGHDVR